MARGGGMEQVELHDADDDAADVVDQSEAPARPRRIRWLVIGAAVVALSLVGTQWVVDAREEAAVARLQDVPGVLPAFGDELTVERTLTREQLFVLWGGSIETAGGATAGLVVAADGSQAFTATDPRTAETVWSTPLLGPNAERAASHDASYGGSCQSDAARGETAELAACLVTDGFVRYSEDGAEERVPATTTPRAVVIDTVDGRVVTELDVDDAAQLAVIPGLLLVGVRDPERGIEVVAHDLRTGDERWRYRAPATASGGSSDGEDLVHSWTLFRAGDVVAVYDGDTLRILSRTGTLVRDDLGPDGRGFGFGPDALTGNLTVSTYDSTGEITMLLTADGDPAGDVVVGGSLAGVAVDDGSVPGLVLTSGSHLQAWDRGTGDELWESDLLPITGLLVVRGRVMLVTASEVVALDGRTGRVVWEQRTPQSAAGMLATDGRDLLVSVPASGAREAAGITGYDLETGERTRHVAYPEGVSDVTLVAGVLLGWSYESDDITVLE